MLVDRIFIAVLAGMMLMAAGITNASTVVNFDDLPLHPVPSTYAGISWGTSSEDGFLGNTGEFYVENDPFLSPPHSSPNFVTNIYGVNNLWFKFGSPVTFDGAWFTRLAGAYTLPGDIATQVRVRDNLGNTSSWLDLSTTPQYLAANFIGSQTIFIERQGGANTSQWYTMDDVTYSNTVPEPSTIILIYAGLGGLVLLRWKSRKQ